MRLTEAEYLELARNDVLKRFLQAQIDGQFEMLLGMAPNGSPEWEQATLERVRQLYVLAELRSEIEDRGKVAESTLRKHGMDR